MNQTTVYLVNPWSGAILSPPWTWSKIQRWARKYVAPQDRRAWYAEARAAFRAGDGDTLGRMIVGS